MSETREPWTGTPRTVVNYNTWVAFRKYFAKLVFNKKQTIAVSFDLKFGENPYFK
jgi:hypothetical protein